MLPEYNGWSNYPTWCVHLWITNEEPIYEYARELVNEEYELDIYRDDALKEWVTSEEWIGEVAGMSADLINFALAHVEWREIADALREE